MDQPCSLIPTPFNFWLVTLLYLYKIKYMGVSGITDTSEINSNFMLLALWENLD